MRKEPGRYLGRECSRQNGPEGGTHLAWITEQEESSGGKGQSHMASKAVVSTLVFILNDVGNYGDFELRNDMICLTFWQDSSGHWVCIEIKAGEPIRKLFR